MMVVLLFKGVFMGGRGRDINNSEKRERKYIPPELPYDMHASAAQNMPSDLHDNYKRMQRDLSNFKVGSDDYNKRLRAINRIVNQHSKI